MSRYRDQSLVNILAGLVIAAEAAFRSNGHATRLASTMYMVSGILLTASGIGLFLARESRSARSLPDPNWDAPG